VHRQASERSRAREWAPEPHSPAAWSDDRASGIPDWSDRPSQGRPRCQPAAGVEPGKAARRTMPSSQEGYATQATRSRRKECGYCIDFRGCPVLASLKCDRTQSESIARGQSAALTAGEGQPIRPCGCYSVEVEALSRGVGGPTTLSACRARRRSAADVRESLKAFAAHHTLEP
jgi:hypothetical protein